MEIVMIDDVMIMSILGILTASFFITGLIRSIT